MNKNNKWFWAFVGAAVLLVVAIVLAALGIAGVFNKDNTDNVPEITEGPETGLYYYNSEDGEFTLQLYGGNQFTLFDGVTKVGEYTVADGNATLTFKKESNGSATAKIEDGVVTLTYNGEEIRFLKKVNYTVTFNTNGGSTVENLTAVNGSSVAKPADPTKDNAVFIGWYYDEALTTPYIFGSSIITADTTLYAKWIEKVAGQIEYTVTFEGADVADMITKGGKLEGVPTPEKEGYTFGGWWISMYESADKLTYKYNADTVFTANTTLFAVWVKTEGKIGLRPEYPPIPDGTRNISLTSIAGQWHTLGYSKEEIYRELLYVNSIACNPPLDVGEIQCITNSVTRYKRER